MTDERPEISAPTGKMDWRPLKSGDELALSQLIGRMENADNPPYRTSAEEVSAWLSDTMVWKGRVGVAQDGPLAGQVVAFGQVAIFRDTGGECVLRAGVDPQYRQLGAEERLISWQIRKGRSLYDEAFPGEPGFLVTNVDPSDPGLEELLVSKGFKKIRTTHELRRELADVPAMPDIGSYREIVQWTPALDGEAWKLFNRLVDQDQHRPHAHEEWMELRESFVADWSYVALSHTGDRPQVEGFILVSAYKRDWEVLGWREGYIDLLGVADAWIRDDLSQALVIASMEAQRRDGMERVAAGVGTAAHSRVTVFFEDLGFEKSFQTRTYSLQL